MLVGFVVVGLGRTCFVFYLVWEGVDYVAAQDGWSEGAAHLDACQRPAVGPGRVDRLLLLLQSVLESGVIMNWLGWLRS